jgi:hypothetical protein
VEQKTPKTPEEEMTWTQEIEITADKLVDRVKQLIEDGSVRRLIVRNSNGDSLLEIPLTAGVAAGTLMIILAPTLAALGALAALVSKVKLDVVRVEDNMWGND